MAGAEIYPSDLMFTILSKFPERSFPYEEEIIHETFSELAEENPQFFKDRGITFEENGGYPKSSEIEAALRQIEKWGYLCIINHGTDQAFINHTPESRDYAEKVLSYFQPDERDQITVFSEKIQQRLIKNKN